MSETASTKNGLHVMCYTCAHCTTSNYDEPCKYCRYNVEDQQAITYPIRYVRAEDARNKNVDHPNHYNKGKIEVWDAIIDWKLDFVLGNVVKYVARAGHKLSKLEDLKKAKFYIEKAISLEEASKDDNT